jgi:hypothetical protein
MVVREDPVAPAPGPVVCRKQRLAGSGGAGTGLDHTAVNNEWERWVVGHAAVISEKVLLDRRGGREVPHEVILFSGVSGGNRFDLNG